MTLQDVQLNLNFVNRRPPAVPLALEPGFAPPQLPEHEPAPLQVPRTKWHGFLRPLNVLLCVVHGIAAGAVFGLTDTDVTEKLYRGTIKTTVVDKTASVDIVPGSHVEFFKLDFAFFTICFFAVTAFFHLRAAVAHELYVAQLLLCRNYFRWFEYAISASIMATTVAYFCTIFDGFQLIALAALTTTTMGYGLVAELVARPVNAHTWSTGLGDRLIPHLLGYVPQAAAWVIIFLQFYLNTVDTEMPRFVYGIVFGQLIVFWSFGLIQLIVLCNKPSSYIYGEVAYMVLSAAGKLLLGAQLLVNVLWSRG
jgi:hypothetical protein